MMRASVAIPAYNEESIIEQCLLSLLAQTIPCEIVVCDNNSTDRTHEIAKMHAHKVVKETRQGVAYAFDAASRATSGELVAFTGADCIVPPYWIERFLPHFDNPRVVACFGPVHALERNYRKTLRAYSLFDKALVKLKLSWGVSNANLIVRRDVLERVGYFDPRVQMLEDSWLMKKIKRYGKIKFIKDNIVKTSVRRLDKQGARKVFIDRTISIIKLKLFHKLGDERFETVR